MLFDDDKPHAIVAEDDPGNRLILCRMLERMGYGVIRAVDGKQAVKIARMGEAPILFMDLNMPETDGYAAARTIRAERATASMRIVAVTGDVTADARSACALAGFDAILAKPVRMDAVEEQLQYVRRAEAP